MCQACDKSTFLCVPKLLLSLVASFLVFEIYSLKARKVKDDLLLTLVSFLFSFECFRIWILPEENLPTFRDAQCL